jgi:glycerol-3-phosphate O-acyltransferase
MILGYHCTLEAQSLISSHLKSTGQEKYVSSGKKGFNVRNLLSFAWKFFSQSSEFHLSFGEPMDVLGYRLDENANSIDERGNQVDIKEFFSLHGKIEANRQRESVYTRKLADKVIENYERYYVVLSSHLVAYTAFLILRKMHPTMDIYTMMRLPVDMLTIPKEVFQQTFITILNLLKQMESEHKIRLQEELHSPDIDEVIHHGIKYLGSFHAVWPLKFDKKQNNIMAKNPQLVYYYHNRLAGFQLEDQIEWDQKSIQLAIDSLQESE